MSTVSIPLSKLRLSPLNVRHPVEGDIANEVHDLQASILAYGLMNPLAVHKLSKPRGHFGVIAGGRRLRALQGLAEDGRISADHEVDCYETAAPPSTLTEMSIAENLVRVALKPTAEYEAFARLAEDGIDEEKIAERFGTTTLHVRQRMRLGRLHPDILAALDASRISLDLAKAYAATADQALQVRVFKEMSGSWQHNAHNVRNAIRGGGRALNADRMLEVVGEQAYLDAGGQLEEDFFTHHKRVLQIGTLNDLYYAKVAEQEAELKARLPVQIAAVTTSAVDLGRPLFASAQLADEQRDRLTEIDARADEIHEQLEQLAEMGHIEDDAAIADTPIISDRPEDQPKVDALRAELGKLQDEGERIHAEAKVQLPDGPVVVLAEPGEDGMVVRGYYRPRGYVEPGRVEGGGNSAGDPPAASLDLPIGLNPSVGYGDPKPAVKAQFGLTADGIEVMRSHRRAILRGMMVDRGEPYSQRTSGMLLPFMVLRLTLQSAGQRGVSAAHVGSAGSFHITGSPIGADDVAKQRGAQAWSAIRADLEAAAWMVEPDLRRAFSIYVELDDDDLELASAVAAGLLLDRSLQAPGYRVPLHDELAMLLGTADDATIRQRYWTPDTAFFDQLPKSRRLAAVEEVAPSIARDISKLPTSEISAACALFFSASEEARRRFTMLPGHLQHARRWMPAFLGFSDEPRGPRIAETLANEAVTA
jgi:ParB family chromosome partitioning protein